MRLAALFFAGVSLLMVARVCTQPDCAPAAETPSVPADQALLMFEMVEVPDV